MQNPTFTHFLLEEDNGIAVFTINRPIVMNALNLECQLDLMAFMDYYEGNENLKVAIITGAGDKAFIAGADINSIKTATAKKALTSKLRTVLDRIENSPKIIIAAINGYAFGGGFELALACDIRIVSDNALVGLPETNLGIIPGAGGTQRLARMVGISVAKDVIIGGRNLKAEETVHYGIAMKCVAQVELLEKAKNVASRIMERGPLAVQVAKMAINTSLDVDRSTGMMYEALALAVTFGSEDRLEGASSFLEKRKANFKGC